jgi:type III pantothenate kinase
MNIAIDIGNSFTHLALFRKNRIVKRIDLPSDTNRKMILKKLKPLSKSIELIGGIGISSVFPEANLHWAQAIRSTFKKKPLIINYKSKLPLQLNVKNASKLGADRICNSVFGYSFFAGRKNVIVIDIGTAITFDVVFSTGEFIGGIIAAGINLSAKSLNIFTKKLPVLGYKDQKFPKSVIGRDTRSAIQSGLLNYSLFAIEGLIGAIESETGKKFEVIISGGAGKIYKNRIKRKVKFIENTVLPGVNYILNYQKSLKK